jgi:hypothetical protein
MASHPDVHIVISSSWRIYRTLAQLCEPFSHGLRERVLGATPRLKPNGIGGHRQRECEAWMSAHAAGATWLALDDEAHLFGVGFAVICDPTLGLSDPRARLALARWLMDSKPEGPDAGVDAKLRGEDMV